MCVYVCVLERLYVCARTCACVCARLRVRAHPCPRDDAHVYASGAHVGALAGAGSRTCGSRACVRVHACMNDYYIILLHVRAYCVHACVRTCVRMCMYVRAWQRICACVCAYACGYASVSV